MLIVWQILCNLVLCVVQVLFKFIVGFVVGGNEDFGMVFFVVGSDELMLEVQVNFDKFVDVFKEWLVLCLEVEGVVFVVVDGFLIGVKCFELEYQNIYYCMFQCCGDKVLSDVKQFEVLENMQVLLFEGIYWICLKQQLLVEWKELDSDECIVKMCEVVIVFWVKSQVLLCQIGQVWVIWIKDYLVEKGQLLDDCIYLIDVSFVEGEDKGNVDI